MTSAKKAYSYANPTGGEWEVWCGADGENIINAHLIGTGHSRDAAVADAVKALEAVIERLQQPRRSS